ncbi:MAG: IS66 family transposase, partial [Chloroflexi bacterium]|nr:IS66 family transposase [Chloroflexota bacterium]
QTDGYDTYTHFGKQPNITLLACMAHARRYFEKAKDNDPKRVEIALQQFQKLYAIERKGSVLGLSYEETRCLRHEKALKVLTEMDAWYKEEIYKVLPQCAIGKAIAYTLRLCPPLVRYIDDCRFQIDNNPIENTIRPIALGRKNYLFARSHDAAQHAAIIYLLMASCKMNDIEPLKRLKETLSKMPDYPANQLHRLLPGRK